MTRSGAKTKQTGAKRRGADTVDRLVDAAERLYGIYGIDAVSMRQLLQEAGVSNKSAIAYHFGDRESFVRAIWERRLPALETSRSAMLKKAVEQGRDSDPFTIMQILVVPSYEPVDEDGFHRYAAFQNQALRWPVGEALRSSYMRSTPTSAEAIELMRTQCSHLSTEKFHWRLRIATGLFFHQAFERDHAIAQGRKVGPEDEFLAEAIEMATACMTAKLGDTSKLLRTSRGD